MNEKDLVKKICDADNKLQKAKHFNAEMKKLHKKYSEVIGEKELLESILKKHGG